MSISGKQYLTVACPKCKAKVGEPCWRLTREGPTLFHMSRGASHRLRIKAWLAPSKDPER